MTSSHSISANSRRKPTQNARSVYTFVGNPKEALERGRPSGIFGPGAWDSQVALTLQQSEVVLDAACSLLALGAGDHMVSTPRAALVAMGMKHETIRQEDEATVARIGIRPVGRYGGETVGGGLPVPE